MASARKAAAGIAAADQCRHLLRGARQVEGLYTWSRRAPTGFDQSKRGFSIFFQITCVLDIFLSGGMEWNGIHNYNTQLNFNTQPKLIHN